MIFFVAYKGIAAFRGPEALSVSEVLFNATWAPWPTGMDGQPSFGILIFLVGSLLVSGLAVLFAAPLAVAAAIFTTEIAPHLGERYLRPALEMFTGVPSVVYGWNASRMCRLLSAFSQRLVPGRMRSIVFSPLQTWMGPKPCANGGTVKPKSLTYSHD
jgi:ABC-type phosphate transport system permease subunit